MVGSFVIGWDSLKVDFTDYIQEHQIFFMD